MTQFSERGRQFRLGNSKVVFCSRADLITIIWIKCRRDVNFYQHRTHMVRHTALAHLHPDTMQYIIFRREKQLAHSHRQIGLLPASLELRSHGSLCELSSNTLKGSSVNKLTRFMTVPSGLSLPFSETFNYWIIGCPTKMKLKAA
jgi:hypothetical protein